jgi:hypothetical protein
MNISSSRFPSVAQDPLMGLGRSDKDKGQDRKSGGAVDRMLWNVDCSNVCFYEIAISIRPKSAKGGSADCFDPNRSRAPTAIASLHQFAARRRTPSAPKKGRKLQGD